MSVVLEQVDTNKIELVKEHYIMHYRELIKSKTTQLSLLLSHSYPRTQALSRPHLIEPENEANSLPLQSMVR